MARQRISEKKLRHCAWIVGEELEVGYANGNGLPHHVFLCVTDNGKTAYFVNVRRSTFKPFTINGKFLMKPLRHGITKRQALAAVTMTHPLYDKMLNAQAEAEAEEVKSRFETIEADIKHVGRETERLLTDIEEAQIEADRITIEQMRECGLWQDLT